MQKRLPDPRKVANRDSLRLIRSARLLAELNFLSRYLYQNGNAILDFQSLDLSMAHLLAIAHECSPCGMQRCIGTACRGSRSISVRLRPVFALAHPDSAWSPFVPL